MTENTEKKLFSSELLALGYYLKPIESKEYVEFEIIKRGNFDNNFNDELIAIGFSKYLKGKSVDLQISYILDIINGI